MNTNPSEYINPESLRFLVQTDTRVIRPEGRGILGDLANNNLIDLVNRGLALALIVAGFLSIVFIFFGGISFILSGGQEDKIKQAVSTIRYAIIGLIVTILAIVVVNGVGGVLGLNPVEYININEIINMVEDFSDQFSRSSSGGGTSSLD